MSKYLPKHLNSEDSRGVKGLLPKKNDEKSSGDFYSFVQCIIESVLAAFLLLTFFVNISVVVGNSMNPTLENGDRLLVTHNDGIKHGDIVAVWAANLNDRETGEKGEYIVKRVIGLPGDVIDIDESGTVYRNGEALREDYVNSSEIYESKGNASFPLTVEDNCVFLLGDNRNHSTDSRFVNTGNTSIYVGCIDQRYIVGKAVFRLFPFDRMGVIK